MYSSPPSTTHRLSCLLADPLDARFSRTEATAAHCSFAREARAAAAIFNAARACVETPAYGAVDSSERGRLDGGGGVLPASAHLRIGWSLPPNAHAAEPAWRR